MQQQLTTVQKVKPVERISKVALLEASKMQNCDENNLTTMRKLAAEHESPTKQASQIRNSKILQTFFFIPDKSRFDTDTQYLWGF